MVDYKNIENYKEVFGKILFAIGILILLALLISPLKNILFTVDEYFTLGLIKFPLMQGIAITSADVHPPFYYILLKLGVKVFSIFNLDIIFISKIISFLPYAILLLVFGTKIKREYGWFTTGLVTFALFSMTEFLFFYSIIRMYSWAILFFLLSFIYLKDIINESDFKSWLLFSIFTVLGAYTHYFCAISSIIMYVLLLITYLINNDKNFDKMSEIKKWFLWAIVMILAYVPWIFALLNQLNRVHGNFWIPQINMEYLLQCFSYYMTISTNNLIMALALIFLVLIFIAFFYCYKKDKIKDKYILIGLLIFVLTIVLGVILSFTFKPILRVRYLIPAAAVFWLAVSILLGKMDNNKFMVILMSFILIMGAYGVYDTAYHFQSYYNNGIQNQEILDSMDNSNSIILCVGPGEVIQFATYFNESSIFMDEKTPYSASEKSLNEVFNIKYYSDYGKLIEDNKDKDIYVIMGSWNDCEYVDENDKFYNIAENIFYKYNSS